MVDPAVYVDPFLGRAERKAFVQTFKQTQKDIREASLNRTQRVFRETSTDEIPRVAAACFREDRLLVVVRAFGNLSDPSLLALDSTGAADQNASRCLTAPPSSRSCTRKTPAKSSAPCGTRSCRAPRAAERRCCWPTPPTKRRRRPNCDWCSETRGSRSSCSTRVSSKAKSSTKAFAPPVSLRLQALTAEPESGVSAKSSSRSGEAKAKVHPEFGVAVFSHEQVDAQWTDEQVKDLLQRRLGAALPLARCHVLVLSDAETLPLEEHLSPF